MSSWALISPKFELNRCKNSIMISGYCIINCLIYFIVGLIMVMPVHRIMSAHRICSVGKGLSNVITNETWAVPRASCSILHHIPAESGKSPPPCELHVDYWGPGVGKGLGCVPWCVASITQPAFQSYFALEIACGVEDGMKCLINVDGICRRQ